MGSEQPQHRPLTSFRQPPWWGSGFRVPVTADRRERSMTLEQTRAAIRNAFRAKLITHAQRDVLYAINTLMAEHPSERRLAGVARCSVSTVKRAKIRAKELGLFHWTRRVVAGIGWRAQISNAYHRGEGKIQYSSRFTRSLKLNLSGRTISVGGDQQAARDELAAVARGITSRLQGTPSLG